MAYVGRDELADVPVFLDPMVPKRMASFRLSSGRYSLYPESAALPILVNGQPLTPGQVLRDGDAIQFGRVTLGYYEKATATGSRRPVDSVPIHDFSVPGTAPGAVAIPRGGSVCQFCAQPFDAQGNCACSVPADPGFVPQMAPPGYDAGGYGAAPGYAAAPDPAYGAAPAYLGQDPGYAATVMDPAMAYGPADMGTGPRLVGIAGPYTGQVFPLTLAELGIGRDPSQELPLTADATASRRHARFLMTPSGWVVRDEGSSNGTWVNGVRVQEQPLFPGDTVRVGGTQLRFEA
jgi:pSer/pThr/pTyr-binding forkhead associated (FHA) protein